MTALFRPVPLTAFLISSSTRGTVGPAGATLPLAGRFSVSGASFRKTTARHLSPSLDSPGAGGSREKTSGDRGGPRGSSAFWELRGDGCRRTTACNCPPLPTAGLRRAARTSSFRHLGRTPGRVRRVAGGWLRRPSVREREPRGALVFRRPSRAPLPGGRPE